MPPTGSKQALTNDELLAQFDDLGVGEKAKAELPESSPQVKQAAPVPAENEHDPLAELSNLAAQRPASRTGTPRLSTESRTKRSTATPPPGRPSEDRTVPRKSGESGQSFRAGVSSDEPKPAPQQSEQLEQPEQSSSAGGGWWGGLFATASAAVKQAEAAVKEIQQNEEALKWAEQVRGNVGALRDLGGELKTLALPTFTNIIHTLAPPISSHERLQIHITHDLSGYPTLDPLIYSVFSRVMSQVEGGDLLVIQRGQEAAPRRGSDAGNTQHSAAGWRDGPWWRTTSQGSPRSISAIKGSVEASKLARASAEAYANEYFASRGGVEEAARQATEVLSESNPVRSSDIFLAIQAVSRPVDKSLFHAGPTAEKEKSAEGVVEPKEEEEEEIVFALYLHDPIHGIAFHTLTQAVPQKWVEWLDAAPPAPSSEDEEADTLRPVVPESIAEIIESGGVDPREWVAEWIEESLTLGVGVMAQRYVARRMGVGEGGLGRGKMKAEKSTSVESGAGEAARAI